MKNKCAILYSGGTDSTAVAALMTEEFQEIHLVSFQEVATSGSNFPEANIRRLIEVFGPKFEVSRIDIDKSLQALSYRQYLSSLLKFHLFNLATPGISALAWHVEMIRYCLKHEIHIVADGLTKELMHFPGHQDFFIKMAKDLYREFGIEYRQPVRDWPCPEDFQLVHKLILDYHIGERRHVPGSTSEYLAKMDFFGQKMLKGTQQDQKMQKDCYPFVVYNIVYFWIFGLPGLRRYWDSVLPRFFAQKFNFARSILKGVR